MLPGTPLHARTAPLCEAHNWRRWGGYVVAGSYELNHEREYAAIRSSAALFDLSPLYKYKIYGPDAERLLNRVVTRDVRKIAVGQVVYTTWCDAGGKVIDDGTLARLEPQTFRLTSADPSYRWLHLNAEGMDVQIDDVSDHLANIGLQGPLSRQVLNQAAAQDISALRYYRIIRAEIAGIPVDISRTGYTGDLGYEIWTPASQALPVWDALVESGQDYGITPAGILALDIARVEAGLMMIEVDYVSAHRALVDSRKSTPYELSLDWTVDLEKGYFVGRKALQEEKATGPAWRFVGIEIDWTSLEKLYRSHGLPPQLPGQAWRTSVPIYLERGSQLRPEQIGYATSGAWSPFLKKYITLAHVHSAFAGPGTPVKIEVTVEHHRRLADARVTRLPFFNPERKRA